MNMVLTDHVNGQRVVESIYDPEDSTSIVYDLLLEIIIPILVERVLIPYVLTSDIVIKLAVSCTNLDPYL